MGQKLALTLNQLIDAQISDDVSRADIVKSIAAVAGLEARDVSHILQGDTNCPPIERLQDFATLLGNDSEAALRSAAEADGCDYGERDPKTVTIREVIPKEQYMRLKRIKEDLERALEPGSSSDPDNMVQ
jgi:hypothetical protein